MGKNQHSKDRLFITATEWKTQYGGKKSVDRSVWRPLPFDCCALSLTQFETPACTPDGMVFDILNIVPWLQKNGTNPVDGEPLRSADLIRLTFHR
jgi:peptidyl-prolyl cis-trans isomerase-like protein 2